ncbi:MAG: hypothetical protein P4N59_10845 [Negativicutes bacterium]|nr:hypothetical protein [Negativicutes bacterium]
MANLLEIAQWIAGIYQLEESDPVQGGDPAAGGIDNLPHQQLAQRTAYLKQLIDAINTELAGVQPSLGYTPVNRAGDAMQGILTLFADPANNMDAVTKQYLINFVNAALNGVVTSFKQPVRVAAPGNIALNGLQTVDGVALAAGDRALLPNQTNAAQNGIWVAAAGAWARGTDANTAALLKGAYVVATEGAANHDTAWMMITDGAITVDTTSISWQYQENALLITASTGLQRIGNDIQIANGGVTAAMLAAGAAVGNFGFTPVNKAGDNLAGAINKKHGDDIASGTTTDIGAATGENVTVTGTATITRFGIIQAGTERSVTFSGNLTITYDAIYMILPGAVDLPVKAGDVCRFESLGANKWRLTDYQPATTFNAHAQKIINLADGAASGEAIHAGQFTGIFAINGYRKFPDGMIIQWGNVSAGNGGNITFPIAFPNAAYTVIACLSGSNNTYTVVNNLSTTGFTSMNGSSYGTLWMAIGK